MRTRLQHKPGNEQGNEAVPEFHAETHPPGTAPKEESFEPNPTTAATADSSLGAGADPLSFPGATSKDVHAGMGMPIQGQADRDIHHQLPGRRHEDIRMHPGKRKKERSGLEGVGANGAKDPVREHGWDLPEGVEKGTKGKHNPDWPGAEEREPEHIV